MPRMRIDASDLDLDVVLFDVGGTLVRLDHAHLAARAERRGHRLAVEAIARGEASARRDLDRRAAAAGSLPGTDADRVVGYLAAVFAGAGVPPERAAELATEAGEEHLRENLWRVPLPGARETLEGLRSRGFRTAVVSNADGRVLALLERTGLAAHLETILDSHVEGVEKPDPEIFHRALERLGVTRPERGAYVGDIFAIDVVGARAAGLHAILIDETGGYADADCVRIDRLDALLGEPRAGR